MFYNVYQHCNHSKNSGFSFNQKYYLDTFVPTVITILCQAQPQLEENNNELKESFVTTQPPFVFIMLWNQHARLNSWSEFFNI